eukprot:GEMP01009063.1.p1 GENE.GEMP01009063.1~~GEMP01009063.1.p1  ORF type:complete len:866 (+),score=180.81 GEMP01009063.1:42-2639(+)
MEPMDDSLACLAGITFPGAIVSWDGVSGNIHVAALNIDVTFTAADNPQLEEEVAQRYGDVTFVLHVPDRGAYEAREIAPANTPGQYSGTITDASGSMGDIRCEELRLTVKCDLSSLPKAYVGQKVTFDVDESHERTVGIKPALDGPMLTRPRVDNRKLGKVSTLCHATKTGTIIPGNLKFKLEECPELIDPGVGNFVVFTALGRYVACDVRYAEGEELTNAQKQESSWHAQTGEKPRRTREEGPARRELLSSPLRDALPWAAKRALDGSHAAKRRRDQVYQGKIKSYNADKCWGFISCKELGDVFYSLRLNPHMQLFDAITPSSFVEFELSAEDTGKKAAINIRELNSPEEQKQQIERCRLLPLTCLGKIVDINPGEFAQIRVDGQEQKMFTMDFSRNPNLQGAPVQIGQYVEFDIDDRGRPVEARTEIMGVVNHPPRRTDWGFMRTQNQTYAEDIFFSLTRNPLLRGVSLENRKVWFRLATERSGKLAAIDADFLEPIFEGTIGARSADGFLMIYASNFPEGQQVDMHLSPDLSEVDPPAEGDSVLFNLSEMDARFAVDVVRKTDVSQGRSTLLRKSYEYDARKLYAGVIDKIHDDTGFIFIDGREKRIFFNFDRNPRICPPEVGQRVFFHVGCEGSGKPYAHDACFENDGMEDDRGRSSWNPRGKGGKGGKEDGDYRKGKGKGGKNKDDRWGRGKGWKDDEDRWGKGKGWKDDENRWGKGKGRKDDEDRWGKGRGWKDDRDRWGKSRGWKDDEDRWGKSRGWKDDVDRSDKNRGWKDDEDRWGKGRGWKDEEDRWSKGRGENEEDNQCGKGKGQSGKNEVWKSFSEGAMYALRTAGKRDAEIDGIIDAIWRKEVEKLGKTHSW